MGATCAVIVSGLLYTLAFVWPTYCFWAVIPVLVLLLWVAEQGDMGFWRGWLWGLLVWGVHSAFVFWSFAPLIGAWWAIGLGWFAMVIYLSLHAGLCGLALGLVRRLVPGVLGRFTCYIVIMTLYFWWMASAVFWPFDYFEGYLLFDLLAPWGAVTSPFLRAPFVWVSWLGLNGARLLLITYAAFWAGAISSFKRASQPLVPSEIEGWRVNFGLERAKLISKIGIGLLLLTSALLAPGFICRDNIPGWSSSIGAVHAGFERMRQVDESAHTANLSSAIARLIAANPAVTVVITPESAFPFCCLDYHQSCARLRKASAGRLLLLGSNRCAGEALCNTSFAFYANGDLTWYDKIHRMFYAERVPSFLTYLGLHDTLVSWIGYEFTAGTCCHPVFSVPKPAGTAVLPSLRPCLCSELFFTDCLAHDPNQSLPVAAQVNDAWYPGTPIPELLWAVARLKACAYGRVIIYVSYTHANIMLPHGELQELHSCT